MKRLLKFIKKYEFPVHLLIINTVFLKYISSKFYTLTSKFKLKFLSCKIGCNFRSDGKLWIWLQKKNSIDIGDNVRINSRFGSNLVGLTNPTIFQCFKDGNIKIGNGCGLSSVVISSRAGISIGSNTVIGGNTRIFDHDFHSLDYIKRSDIKIDQMNIKSKPISIGDNVFIGTNVLILKGVKIGDRSIIGAGSVVTKNIDSDQIWAGNPAVKISIN